MAKFYSLLIIFVGLLAPSVAMACPTTENTGYELNYTGSQLWQPQSRQVRAGGDIYIPDCRNLPPNAVGFAMQDPDFTVFISEVEDYELEFRVDSECDTTLLISGQEWFFDDDDNGDLDPLVRFTNPANGRYDIWVGTYSDAYCDSVLTVETF